MVTEKVTMKKVAKLAGVSQPTVSHFINNSAPVSNAVAERVQRVINELGYVPNALAKSLKMNKTNTIGLMIPDVMDDYYSELTKNIESILREYGFITFLCNTSYDKRLEELYINSLIQQKVAGIIIGYGFANKKVYEDVHKSVTPMVLLDGKVDNDYLNIPSVEIDDFKGNMLVVEHLYKIGSKKICYASEPLFNRTLISRFQGFLKAAQKFGYKESDIVCEIENNYYNKVEMGFNIGAKIILNNNVDAVFASSDLLAFGIIQRLKEHNLNKLNEIAIVGYDDVLLSRLLTPSLTSVSQPKNLMSRKSVEMILAIINNETLTEKKFLLEPILMVRDSTMLKAKNNWINNIDR